MPWIQSSPGQIYPDGSSSPMRPGSLCPQGWEENFDRANMSTQVFIAHAVPSDVPDLRYIFPSDTGTVPPASGEMVFDAAQPDASVLYISLTDDLGEDATLWIGYLHGRQCELSVETLATTKESRAYAVTGTPTIFATHAEIPVFWTDGTVAIPHGPVDVALSIGDKLPELWQDPFGVDHYGRMPFDRTDLISTDTSLFLTLADRILEVRGSNSVPRLEAVTLDARTGGGANVDVMSTADPGKPSRYLMRLAVEDRLIFDRMCFATAVRHFIARDEWTLRITLDLAEWAGTL